MSRFNSKNRTTIGRIGTFTLTLSCLWALIAAPVPSNPEEKTEYAYSNLDSRMQTILEAEYKNGLKDTKATQGFAMVVEVGSREVKAIVNHPLATVPWEPGSVMKPLMITAAINEGKMSPDATYYEPGFVQVDAKTITNAIKYPPQTVTTLDILRKSLNTGAVYALKSLGGGELNEQARRTWYSYLTEKYGFGVQGGYVRSPDGGKYLNERYASMAFGVGMTVTPTQLANAFATILEGKKINYETSLQIRQLLQKTLETNNPAVLQNGYIFGGKSGTAPLSDSTGNYPVGKDSGTYVGFFGRDTPRYILLVRLDEPETASFASTEAAKVWAKICKQVIKHGILE